MSDSILINFDDINKPEDGLFTRFLIKKSDETSNGNKYVTIGIGCVFTTYKTVAYMLDNDIVITYPNIEIMHLDFPENFGYSIIYLDKFIPD